MNEFDFINRFIKSKQNSLPPNYLGIGDDASGVPFGENQKLVTTTDILAEDIHFRLNHTSMEELGYKALAVNISDISAMGATPRWVHASLAVPPKISQDQLNQFFKGFCDLADKHNIILLGGDLCGSKRDFFVSVTLSGLVDNENLKTRDQFKPGDKVYLTGPVGDSAAGFRLLEKERKEFPELIKQHRTPRLYVEEGVQLGKDSQVNGMMDVSDGIDSDLQRITEAANCGFEIDLANIPLSPSFLQACQQFEWYKWDLALAGGEDYCLLFGGENSKYSCIGRVTDKAGVIDYLENGKKIDLNLKPFSHFGENNE